DRFDLVVGGVRRIEHATDGVESHLTLDPGGEFGLEQAGSFLGGAKLAEFGREWVSAGRRGGSAAGGGGPCGRLHDAETPSMRSGWWPRPRSGQACGRTGMGCECITGIAPVNPPRPEVCRYYWCIESGPLACV